MASNTNNDDDPRNEKQKKTEVVEHVDQDSSNDLVSLPLSTSAPIAVVVPPAVSFGTILEEFPDFLSCVLLYIADRVIWNSIASSNKDMHGKSKAILPPWPLYYKLPYYGTLLSWSPCGTRITCSVYNNTRIVILDQRRGPLRRWTPTFENGDGDGDDDWITDLKFSPNGRFLVSTGDDGNVRLWNTVTANYELLQEWNMAEQVGEELTGTSSISISTCSKYMTMSMGTCSFLLDVENRGKTIKSLLPPFAPRIRIDNIQFSANDRAIFICRNEMIQVWHPHLDADDEDCLITLWRQTDAVRGLRKFKFSHDNTMVALHDVYQDTGTVWSIDTNQRFFLTKKFDVQGSTGLHFTPDGKYIVVNNKNGRSTLWSIAEGTYTNKTLNFFDNGNNYTTRNNLVVKSFSPNNRQCIVRDHGTGNCYITSYFVK